MKLRVITMAAMLTVGSIGIASATPINLIQNGNFSDTHTPSGAHAIDPSTPTQLNYAAVNPNSFLHCCRFASYGEFVDHWTTTGPIGTNVFGDPNYADPNQHVVWFPSAYAAGHTNASGRDAWLLGPRPLLPESITAPSGTGTFIGIQASGSYHTPAPSGIQQTVTGLQAGQTYTVSFDWAATQDRIDTGVVTSWFNVGLGNDLSASIANGQKQKHETSHRTTRSDQGTGIFGIPNGSHTPATFGGWVSESFNFVASAGSQVLSFIAHGTPSGIPPFALLTNVKMTPKGGPPVSVPAPRDTLILLAGGLLLLGFGMVIRRRRRSTDVADGDVLG